MRAVAVHGLNQHERSVERDAKSEGLIEVCRRMRVSCVGMTEQPMRVSGMIVTVMLIPGMAVARMLMTSVIMPRMVMAVMIVVNLSLCRVV